MELTFVLLKGCDFGLSSVLE